MDSAAPFTLGAIVRRQGRRLRMVVTEIEAKGVTCGWTANGRFYRRRFRPQALVLISSCASLWPLT